MIQVFTFCGYFIADEGPVTLKQTYHANKFIKAIKGDGVNGYAWIPVPYGAETKRLDSSNADDSLNWAAEIISNQLRLSAGGVLVPIPGRTATSKELVAAGRTFKIASELGKRTALCAEPLLWWDQEMQSARSGGPRDPHVLLSHLVLGVPKSPATYYIVLDDVLTTGGHLQAAEARLRQTGVSSRFAVVVGRATHSEEEEPFRLQKKELAVV